MLLSGHKRTIKIAFHKPVAVSAAAVCLFFLSSLAPSRTFAQTNILPGGNLEDYGTQKNSGDKAAANICDGSTSTRWESDDPMSSEYFIFSFAGGGSFSFTSLNLYNKGDDKSVKYFQIFYSSTGSAAADPDDSSWQPISPSGSFVNDKMNLINIRMGAVLEDFGTEKDSDKAAELAADGSTKTKWENDKDSGGDEYFIFSFPDESTEQPDSFVLYNDKKKGVKKFELYYSTDPAVKHDPDHGSWVQINGTYSAAKDKSAQTYEFSSVSAKYFLFKITDTYKNDEVKIYEMQLYGAKTLGDGNMWKAEKSTSRQSFSFNSVSGKYFLFKIGGNYDDKKASMNELELMGSQSGYGIIRWREVND